MVHAPHILRAAHHRGKDLVVVLTSAQVPGNTVRQLQPGGVRVCLEESHRGHDESGHTKRALESLLVDYALLNGMQGSVLACETFDRHDVPAPHRRDGELRLGWRGLP